MKNLIAIILLATASLNLNAIEVEIGESLELTWSIPTAREAGEALLPEELAGYEILIHCDDDGQNEIIVLLNGLQQSYTFPDWQKDTPCQAGISAVDTDAKKSGISNLVPITPIPANSPPAKTTLTVTVPDKLLELTKDCEVNISCRIEDR